MNLIDKYLALGETAWPHIARRVAGLMLNHEDEVRDALTHKLFLPSTPILRCARIGSLNMMSCHNLEVQNSIKGIWTAALQSALTFKSGGGGVGLDLSLLSPRGTPLRYAKETEDEEGNPLGVATGPVSFMPLYRETSLVLGASIGGKNPGIMVTLNAKHPDVLELINLKQANDRWQRFNLTVTLDSGPDELSSGVWQEIVNAAWLGGEPGIAFLRNINSRNPVLKEYGRITTLNVCAENPDYGFGACALASAHLPNLITKLGDYGELHRIVHLMVFFLNRVIELNHYPFEEIRQQVRKLRRIGVGLMGWGELLEREGVPFASVYANSLAREVVKEVYEAADAASWKLAERDGGYMKGRRRNVTLLAIAPNGHIGKLGETTSSIYPNLYDPDAYAAFLELTPRQHVNHVMAFQGGVDGGVAYTANVPNDASVSYVDELFRRAYSAGCSSMTVYRDGSRAGQPCNMNGSCSL